MSPSLIGADAAGAAAVWATLSLHSSRIGASSALCATFLMEQLDTSYGCRTGRSRTSERRFIVHDTGTVAGLKHCSSSQAWYSREPFTVTVSFPRSAA